MGYMLDARFRMYACVCLLDKQILRALKSGLIYVCFCFFTRRFSISCWCPSARAHTHTAHTVLYDLTQLVRSLISSVYQSRSIRNLTTHTDIGIMRFQLFLEYNVCFKHKFESIII